VPHIHDSTRITVSLNWLIATAGLLITIASSGGVLLYQVQSMRGEIAEMHLEQTRNREAIIALTATLQGQGVLK